LGRPRPSGNGTPHLTWTLFSRHIQFVTTEADAYANPFATGVLIGNEAAKLGFSAVDLTVRSAGFVDPSMVKTNLPPIVEGIRSTGMTCDQITAGITDLTTEFAMDILQTAAGVGIRSYRFGNYRWSTTSPPPFGHGILQELESFKSNLLDLQEANRRLGLLGFYYTFSGTNIGASIWDMMHIFDDPRFDPRYIGLDYASAHVVASGATGNWVPALEFAMPFVRGISLGDTILVQKAGGASDVGAFPGTGIVNWQTFFTTLLQGGFNGSLSELFEYTLNGVSLNNTWWADTFPTSITTSELESSITSALAYFKSQAAAAGWTASQQT